MPEDVSRKQFDRPAAVVSGLALALLLALGDTAAAQDETPVDPGAAGPDTVIESYGNWQVRCIPPVTAAAPAEGGDATEAEPRTLACEAMQELFQSETGQRLVAVAFNRAGDGAGVTIVAPFGLLLPEGIVLTGNGTELARIGFRTCLPTGCIARADLDADTVAALIAAPDLTLSMRAAAGGEPVTIPLLRAGLTEAWGRLSR